MTNREIDALVAEKVMGKLNVREFRGRYVWDNVGYVNGEPAGDVMGVVDVPEYSTDIFAAWQVVDKFIAADVCKRAEGYSASFVLTKMQGWIIARADTAPMAMCVAALKAKGVDL